MKPIVSGPVEVDNKEDFLLDAVRKSNVAYTYNRDNFDNAENSLSFIFGNQYDELDLKDKEEMNRVAMTFNKLPQFINKVVGAQRSTVHTIKVTPNNINAGNDEPELILENGEMKKESEVLSDMVREIEYSSNAKSWYKMAFKHSLEGGFGFLRVLTQYADDSFDLDIKIKGVRDRWSVLIDPYAQEPDMSDMNYCFISESMPKKEFEKRYPGKSYEALPGTRVNQLNSYWETEDRVTVSEYFRREPIKKKIALGSDGNTYYWDDVKDNLVEMATNGIEMIEFRDIDTYQVVWCKISQGDILEEDIIFPTTTIPVVPVLGRQFDFRNKRRLRGLVDDGIDSQRALNVMMSAAVERVDDSPISPFIATDKAIEGREEMWAEANSVKYATLIYKKGEERPMREMGATMPSAEIQTSSVLDESMKASIGIFNASLGATSNEISGKAIEARQQEADVGTYEFLDNYNDAIRRVGMLVVELIPSIYDTNRTIKLRDETGDSGSVTLNRIAVDEVTGQPKVINKINKGRRSVEITSGQSYETRAQQNASQILELMKVNPNVAQVGSDLLVKNLDFADSDVLGSRLERTIPKEYLSKEKREELAKDAPEPQPSPEQQQAELEMKTKEMELQAKQKEAEIKLQIEQIKLQQAQVALETKKVESQMTIQREGAKTIDQDSKRKDEIAKGIVSQMVQGGGDQR